MSTQEEVNDFINILMQQRNEALNKLAEAMTTNVSLQRQISKENENADNTETSTVTTD
tara:strand:- start:39 stop:212 length:174 start_codon:yes stop_codon:yes gene_type:complete